MNKEDKNIKETIGLLIETNDNAIVNSLLIIYDRQTSDEQRSENTIENNTIGFTGFDGRILTSFANQYLEKGYLSRKQKEILRKRMPKYWRQINDEVNGNLGTLTVSSFKTPTPSQAMKLFWKCSCGKTKVCKEADGGYPEGIWHCQYCGDEYEWGT